MQRRNRWKSYPKWRIWPRPRNSRNPSRPTSGKQIKSLTASSKRLAKESFRLSKQRYPAADSICHEASQSVCWNFLRIQSSFSLPFTHQICSHCRTKSLHGYHPCSSDFFCMLASRSCLALSAAEEASRFRCSKVRFSSFAAVPASSLAF